MNIGALLDRYEGDPAGLEQFLKVLEQNDDAAYALRADWRGFMARPEQIEPDGDWTAWLYLAGRGAGKTRSGAEWVREQIKAGVGIVHLIAPTAADARDVMVEGPSGVLSVSFSTDVDNKNNLVGYPEYSKSNRSLTWANGARALLFSAEQPDRLRGPQCHRIWADELAAWNKCQETWDNAMFGLRLPDCGRPRVMVTTTPRPVETLRRIMQADTTRISRSSTFANQANLSPDMIRELIKRYSGTRIGRQELEAELLDDFPNALWTLGQFEGACRVPDGAVPPFSRIVVAVDPSGAANDEGEADAIGIVVAALDKDRHKGYLLGDYTLKAGPMDWARQVVAAYHKHNADVIVVERNFGGAMAPAVIQTVWRGAPIRTIWASRGKHVRAEPIAALYNQGRIHHVGASDRYRELEDELIKFTTDGFQGARSPNRADALVWAFSELFFPGESDPFPGIAPLAGMV